MHAKTSVVNSWLELSARAVYTIHGCNATQYNVNKNPTDATVCRYLFTAKLLYMFRVSQHPSSGVLNTVPAASGTSSMTCTGGCGYSI